MSLGDAMDRLATLTRLDPAVERAGALVAKLPPAVRDALHGTWLGHPLHPALAQVPVGAWVSSSVLDLVAAAVPDDRTGRRRGLEDAATLLVGTGLATAPAAAAAGLADWSQLHPDQQRIGAVHAAGNAAATVLLAASFAARRRGRHGRGRALGLLGVAVAGASAGLGGHLAYRFAAGANHAEEVPHTTSSDWTSLGALHDLPEGRPVARDVGGTAVAVVRTADGAVHVLADACSHLSGPLSEGEVRSEAGGECLVCPWHGSAFRLVDGAVLRGPATAPAPVFDVRVVDGEVSARVRSVEDQVRARPRLAART